MRKPFANLSQFLVPGRPSNAGAVIIPTFNSWDLIFVLWQMKTLPALIPVSAGLKALKYGALEREDEGENLSRFGEWCEI